MSTTRCLGGHDGRGERGAAAVEFAILAPLVFALVFGMLTGGLALNRKLSLTHGAREAARLGATLEITNPTSTWLTAVADRAQTSAAGELDAGVTDRYICVAYIGATTSNLERGTSRLAGGQPCYPDGRPADEPRVQVVVERPADFFTFFFNTTVTLRSAATARYELDPDV